MNYFKLSNDKGFRVDLLTSLTKVTGSTSQRTVFIGTKRFFHGYSSIVLLVGVKGTENDSWVTWKEKSVDVREYSPLYLRC